MMKRFLTLFLIPVSIFGQIEDWYGVDLSRLGYKHNTFTFEQQKQDNSQLWGNQNTIDFELLKVTGGSFEFSADVYSKHTLFNIDASSLLDIGATLFQFKDKERWWNNSEYFVNYSDILPIRLAFGTRITPFANLYVGGQYSLHTIGINYKSNVSPYTKLMMGGNTYGFGGHIVTAFKFLNLRYSYMYDWSSFGGYFKGNRIQNELVLSIGVSYFGAFVKYKHSFTTSNAGYLPNKRSGLFKSSYENTDFSWQNAQFANKSEISFGVYLTGLFSSVSNASTRIIGETEIGVAKERREKRRRTIEYKEN